MTLKTTLLYAMCQTCTFSCIAYHLYLCHLPITLEGTFRAIINSSLYLIPHTQSHLVLPLPCFCYMSLYILYATNLVQACNISHLEYLKLASALFCLSSLSFYSILCTSSQVIPNDPLTLLKTFQWKFNAFRKKIQPQSIIFSPTVLTGAQATQGYFTVLPQMTYILFCLLAFGSASFFGHIMHTFSTSSLLNVEMES